MSKYAELRSRQQQAVNDLPLGFAFSNEQFAEMMKKWGLDPEKDLDKIYGIPGGGYIQKKDYPKMQEVYKKNNEELEEAIAGDETGDGFIFSMFLYELRNHEYGYTGDYEDTLDALGYTMEQVQADERLKHGLEKAANLIMRGE